MGTVLILLIVIVCGAGLLALFAIGKFNSLVTLRNRYQNGFSQINIQLRRRYDLIPNLVKNPQRAISSTERETLETVVSARNPAYSAGAKAAANPGDPRAMRELTGAEAGLNSALGRPFAVAEAYPELKANQKHASAFRGADVYRKQDFLRAAGLQRRRHGLQHAARGFSSQYHCQHFDFAAAELFLIQNASEKSHAKSILHMIPLNPSRSVFMEQAAAANVVPVWTEIVADGDTPVSAFAKIGGEAPSFLLESAEQSDQVGRYSFLGAGARLMISARDKTVTVTENGEIRTFASARDPLDELQRIIPLPRCARAKSSGFRGGVVGYLGYDSFRWFDSTIAPPPKDELCVPDMFFLLTGRVIILTTVAAG